MPARRRSEAHSCRTAVADPSWKRPLMVGSPRPVMRTSPFSVPDGSISPRIQTLVVTSNDGLRMSIAAAVVKSFMLDAGVSGSRGFRSATMRPLSTSAIRMPASELRATEPLTREASRSSNVFPTAADLAGAGALRATAGLCLTLFFFFFDWAPSEGPANARERTMRIAARREGRDVIARRIVQRGCREGNTERGSTEHGTTEASRANPPRAATFHAGFVRSCCSVLRAAVLPCCLRASAMAPAVPGGCGRAGVAEGGAARSRAACPGHTGGRSG